LNESYSDVFAAMIDNVQPWLITSDDNAQTILRNIAEPDDGYPRRMSEWVKPFDDRCKKLREMLIGCVHANSVIPSRAAYFLTEGGDQDGIHVRGIGKTKVEQIYYDTLINRLGVNSNFIQARQASVSACKSLIGGIYFITDNDCLQVELAFTAVGIGIAPPFPNPTPYPTMPPDSGNATSTLLVVDVSGSMGNNWHGGIKIESAKSAANDIVNMIEQESQVAGMTHQVGLATFTTDATLALGLSPDYNQVRQAIAGLIALNSTNIGAGLTVANQALLQANNGSEKYIILLSDGQSNTGLSYDEIIAGPVGDAAAAGTCIYTVGFGDQGDIDEDLLQRIALGSGCGKYYYASDVTELENIYIRIRHVSMGNVLAEYQGTISQGQTLNVGQFIVPTGQSELALSLHWPGSMLDMQLFDPKGRIVDQNYPSANITTYPNMIYALIGQPLIGNWNLSIYGKDIPEGSTAYDAIASSRVGSVTPTATVFGPGILVALFVLAVGGVSTYAVVRRRSIIRGKSRKLNPAGKFASLRAISGPIEGRIIDLPLTGTLIGRARTCNLQIQDITVSRQHARLLFGEGQWFIQDQGSKSGTYVNGQKVSAIALNPGDRIKIGSSEFEFRN
jgi:hypothetical protein